MFGFFSICVQWIKLLLILKDTFTKCRFWMPKRSVLSILLPATVCLFGCMHVPVIWLHVPVIWQLCYSLASWIFSTNHINATFWFSFWRRTSSLLDCNLTKNHFYQNHDKNSWFVNLSVFNFSAVITCTIGEDNCIRCRRWETCNPRLNLYGNIKEYSSGC